MLTVILTFNAIIEYRQTHRRLTLSVRYNVNIIENRFPILFEPFALKDTHNDNYEYDISNYQQADKSASNFLKYIINFVFYRFGLEVNRISNSIFFSRKKKKQFFVCRFAI